MTQRDLSVRAQSMPAAVNADAQLTKKNAVTPTTQKATGQHVLTAAAIHL